MNKEYYILGVWDDEGLKVLLLYWEKEDAIKDGNKYKEAGYKAFNVFPRKIRQKSYGTR